MTTVTASYQLSLADHLAWYDDCLLLPSGESTRSSFLFLTRLRRWRYARQVRSFGSKGAFGPRTLELGSEAVREFSDSFDFSTHWKDVAAVSLTPTHLFIAHSSMNAHIVPLRCFGSAEAQMEFVDFAQSHIPAAA